MLAANVGVFCLAVGLAAMPGRPGADGAAADCAAADCAAVVRQYEEARSHVGRGSDAHVKLALWCEAHGLNAERVKHLALAVLADPANVTARGLLGLVSYRGRWERPDSVSQSLRTDEALARTLAAYNTRRDHTPETAEAQWRLALWCEERGLQAEARAHLAAVVRLDPSRDAAWRHLGYKKVNGRWMTEEQLAAEKAEADAQKTADRKWKPLLARWRAGLANRDRARREAAEAALADLVEPRAVPAVWAVFVTGKTPDHPRAVQLLSRIDAAASSRALAFLAVFDPDPQVRRASTESLRRRDPREFAGLLVALLQDPIRYEVRPVGGPGSPGAILIGGKRANLQRVYAPPAIPAIPVPANAQLSYDAAGLPLLTGVSAPVVAVNTAMTGPRLTLSLAQLSGFNPTDPLMAQALTDYRAHSGAIWSAFYSNHPSNARLRHNNPAAADRVQGVALGQATTTTSYTQEVVQVPVGRIIAEYRRAALGAEYQLEQDVAALEGMNSETRARNGRVAGVLRDVSGRSLGESPEPWRGWVVDLHGYSYTPEADTPKPTVVQDVPLDYTPQPPPVLSGTVVTSTSRTGPQALAVSSMPSCFGAGTPVQTLAGPRPIESLKVGDRVLTQNPRDGSLAYHPILVVHHNPPSPTFEVKVKSDTIVASPFHRFWVIGRGWVMARDLKGGETLRLLDGPARVDSVSEGAVQPVFNLDVADDHDFFAGAAAALVHDNTLPDTRLVLFDATPELATLATASGPR